MIRLKIHDDDEDPRYPYLYDAWSNLLQQVPPIDEGTATEIIQLVIQGFTYINKFLTEKTQEDSNSSGSVVANYSRMIKAMKLLTSLSIHKFIQPKIKLVKSLRILIASSR